MNDISPNNIKAVNFSSTFEQICNFIAVAKTGDPATTVKGLLKVCLIEFPGEKYNSSESFSESIEAVFGLKISTSEIEKVLGELEKEGIIICSRGNEYRLSSEETISLQEKIKVAKDLEERVKVNWFSILDKKYPDLPHDQAWKTLRGYLSRTFRRHGIQAASLIDPSLNAINENEVNLSAILNDSIQDSMDSEFQSSAYAAISDFLAEISIDIDRTRYIAQLADGAFNFFTLEVPFNLAKKLVSELSPLTLFLDTNFLFGIMDLDNNAQVEVSHNLLRAISEHNLPFKLRYHDKTCDEVQSTIIFYRDIIRSKQWDRSLSRAASKSRSLSGVELRFHEENAHSLIDVDEFFRPFEHLDVSLSKKNIKIFRPIEVRQEKRADLYNEYKDFLEKNGKGQKSYETIMHDASILEEARHLRTKANSSLEAGALIISCDYYFYRFDWETSQRNGEKACVLLPNIFWQILRPYIPADQNFEKAFAETFSLPEFRVVSSGGNRACSKMLQILASYRDVPEETAFKLLSNGLLLDKLRGVEDEDQFSNQVEAAFVEENKQLMEEKASLEQELKDKKNEIDKKVSLQEKQHDSYEEEKRLLNEQIDQVHGEMDEIKEVNIKHQADLLEKVEIAETKIIEKENEVDAANQKVMNMRIIAGSAFAILLVLIFELFVVFFPLEWLLNHKHSVSLQVGFDVIIVFSSLSFAVEKWRTRLVASIFAVLCILIPLL